jgi:hypothetical protein
MSSNEEGIEGMTEAAPVKKGGLSNRTVLIVVGVVVAGFLLMGTILLAVVLVLGGRSGNNKGSGSLRDQLQQEYSDELKATIQLYGVSPKDAIHKLDNNLLSPYRMQYLSDAILKLTKEEQETYAKMREEIGDESTPMKRHREEMAEYDRQERAEADAAIRREEAEARASRSGSSGSSSSPSLAGTWEDDDGNTWTFNRGGSGTMSGEDGLGDPFRVSISSPSP